MNLARGKLLLQTAAFLVLAGFSLGSAIAGLLHLGYKYGLIPENGKLQPVPKDWAKSLPSPSSKGSPQADFDLVGSSTGPLTPVRRADKWGFINTAGSLVVAPQFSAVKPGSNNRIPVQRDGKWGYLDYRGQLAIPFQFDAALPFHNTYGAIVKEGSIFRSIDDEGKRRSPIKVTFSEGLAPIRLIHYGFIDEAGELIIPAIYAEVKPFKGGSAEVRLPFTTDWQVIDRTGHPLAEK